MKTIHVVAIALTLGASAAAQTPAPTERGQDSRFTERFRAADTNGDGVITEAEARAAGLWFTDDLSSVDQDHSGTVTVFEFAHAVQQRLSRWMSDFDAADTDHNGQLSEDEAKQAPNLSAIFKTGGTAKHGTISRPEYESYAIKRIYRDSELPSVAPNLFEKRF